MIPIDLTGQTALITGASGGLGRAIVRTLAEAGADIVIHYLRDKSSAEKLASEVIAMGKKSYVVQADITCESEVSNLKSLIEKEFTLPTIVVANAVIQYEWKSVLEQSVEDFKSQFESCVLQNLFLAKTFVPTMIEKGYGRVIGINTECAMQCDENQSAYVAGKRGMDGLYRVLAKEIGQHGITVNQVAPGWLVTDKMPEDMDGSAEFVQVVPMRRRGTVDDVAKTVAFLASDMAGFITGAYVPVCGGMIMPAI